LVKGRVANKLTTPAKKFFLRSPNGAACPSPKPRRASRRRLAASADCARWPPLGTGALGETVVGSAGATRWVGASGEKGRSRAAVPPPRRPSRAGGPASLLARPCGAGRWPAGSRQAGPPRV
jgi:hypothetical protein